MRVSDRRRAAIRWRAYCIPAAIAALLIMGLVLPEPHRPGRDALPAGLAQVGEELLLDINAATAKQLTQLPGIGDALAEAVVEYREKIGGFDDVWQLAEVDGIGPGKLEGFSGKICATPRGG